MKRRLNILCVIVMLVLSYSVLETGYYLFIGAKAGLEAANAKGISPDEKRELMNIKYLSLIPHSFSIKGGELFQDSIYNEKSETYVPVAYSTLVACVDNHPAVWENVVDKLLTLLQVVVYVWAITLFIRLIVSINRSDIFNWRNVRRLRRLGSMLVIGFCCSLTTAYLTVRSVGEVFSIRGYDLGLSDLVGTTLLVLGICSLIVGEVFAIGLKMKEEQDLTI